MGRTLLDKIWDAHTVRVEDGGRCVLYIDRQYIHEVTSPVAFAGIERRGFGVARPAQITATADHNIPTVDQHLPIGEPESRRQVETLAENCARHGIEHFGVGHPRQGIVHIIGPELGVPQPGCSACLAMNADKIPAGKYSVSTSNRNFEGRQGPGARTMLSGVAVAAAAAVTGVISDPREVFDM